jgi:uncharacterized protein HemX
MLVMDHRKATRYDVQAMFWQGEDRGCTETEATMDQSKNWIAIIVALIVGAGATYFYMQQQSSTLSEQIATLQAQLTDANAKAASATNEIDDLKRELSEQAKLVEEQKAKLAELEAASRASPSPAPQ